MKKKNNKTLTMLILACALYGQAGCSDPDADVPFMDDPGVEEPEGPPVALDANGVPVLRCVDDDLSSQLSPALQGPGWDSQAGGLINPTRERYVVATTLFHYTTDRATFDKTVAKIVEAAKQTPGFIAIDYALSEKCSYGRTITYWETLEDEMAFVTSGVHLEAIMNLRTYGDDGRNVHWMVSPQELPISWTQALEQLAPTLPAVP